MSEFRRNMKWLMGFYRPLKGTLILIAVQSVVVALLSAAIPFVYIRIIDGIQEQLSVSYLLKSIGILLVLGLLNFGFSVTNATRRAFTNIKLEWLFRQKTFERLIRLNQDFYTRFRIGDVVTRLTDDVGRKLSWFACSGIFRAWESSMKIVFSLVAMSLIDPRLTLIALIPFPLQIFIYFKSAGVLDRRFRALQTVISSVNETIETCFSGIRVIQAYCAENRQARKFMDVAEDRARAEVRAEKAHIFVHFLYGYFWQLAQVLVLLGGGWMVINGHLTIGQYVAFDYYILFLVWPMFDIGGLLVGYRRAAVSMRRLQELDGYQPSITNTADPAPVPNTANRVVFENVSFYRDDRPVLDRISFDARDHRMIAVVGEIGSGKSTLLHLLCRFFDPDTGTVTLDGLPLPTIDLADLRRTMGYVSQESLLFSDTVKNNIRFGRDRIPDDKLHWAADIARLTEEVRNFSNGYDTHIGLRGMTVSGGQKQRISIARALAGEPQILVMDDATAHLDAETEEALWTSIYTVLPRIRTFVSSHRTSTLERADLILVMKNGALVEQGAHDDLMARRGEYYRIYSRRKLEETIRRDRKTGA